MPRKNRRKKEKCLNCAYLLSSGQNFCPDCSQENHYRTVPLKQLFLDFLGDYFTFDSKLFRSIVPLLIKPGYLTTEFNAGHRVKYIHPLRLYVFISVVFFFVITLDNHPTKMINGIPVEKHESLLDTVSVDLGGEEKIKMAKKDLEKMVEEKGIESLLDSIGPKTAFERIVGAQVLKALTEDEATLVNHVLNTCSVYVFVLMPVYALLLLLVFRRRKMLYIEHLIFSFHIHAFFFVIETIWFLFNKFVFDIGFDLIPIVVTGLYIAIAIYKVYNTTKLGSAGYMVLSGVVYVVLIIGLMIPVSFVSLALF